jgi:hypothetical protein
MLGGGIVWGSGLPSAQSPRRPQLSNASHFAVLHWLANCSGVVGVPAKQPSGPRLDGTHTPT